VLVIDMFGLVVFTTASVVPVKLYTGVLFGFFVCFCFCLAFRPGMDRVIYILFGWRVGGMYV